MNQSRINKLVLFCDLNNNSLNDGIKEFFNEYITFSDNPSNNKSLGSCVEIIDICLNNVHSYHDIWTTALQQWPKTEKNDKTEFYFNVSSGTTAMKAFLLVLGQAYYGDNAKFVQVANEDPEKEGNPRVDEFNFDLNLASIATNTVLENAYGVSFNPIFGESLKMLEAKKRAAKAAKTDLNVLIYGETGTGKELFAEAIHKDSARKDQNFYAINCACLPPNFLESKLFGYEKGAFTGAVTSQAGLLEELDGGTLFIDELEVCPAEVQAKLLRVLQPPRDKSITCRQFSRLGSNKLIEKDVRIIAATNERLDKKEFRSDLLNRVSQLTISLPPLRERTGDIGELAKKLFEIIKEKLGKEFSNKKLCEDAITFIESRAWFGNVRELQNALMQAIVFSEKDSITEDDFDKNLPEKSLSCAINDEPELTEKFDLKEFIEEKTMELRRKYVEKALAQTGGNKTKAAELLGITYQTIDNWKKTWDKDYEK